MAMIKCPECGKEFSDKAPACPNCGCPISEVIKSASSENERKAAADKMIAAVNRAMEKARKAGAAFEVDSQDIQKMTKENQIDLNSAAAASTVGMLVRTAASACDRLYYAYQNLIPELDEECRPLLINNPGATAILAVLGMIQWLNEESEIENNYAVTFNNVNYGDVVKAKYIPGQKNRLIQNEWETIYLKEGKSEEAETFWEKRLSEHQSRAVEAERNARKDAREIERMMREEERREKQEEETKQKQLREEFRKLYGAQDEERKRLTEDLKNAKSKLQAMNQQNRPAGLFSLFFGIVFVITSFIITANSQGSEKAFGTLFLLAGIGLIAFGIMNIMKRKNEFQGLQKIQADAETKLKEYQSLPTEDDYIRSPKYRSGAFVQKQYATGAQAKKAYSSDDLKKVIVDALTERGPMTVSELVEQIPELSGESGQHISALCRGLRLEGKVESFTQMRNNYYKIPD